MVNCMHRGYVHAYIQPGFEHQLQYNAMTARESIQYLSFQWPRQGVNGSKEIERKINKITDKKRVRHIDELQYPNSLIK